VRRALAPLALVALAAGGCGGGGGSAQDVLHATATSVGKIHSADVRLHLELAPRTNAAAGRVGFSLAGPVDLGRGGLPKAKLVYTQVAGPRQGSATFIADGRDAFVEVKGTPYHLASSQTRALQQSAGTVRRTTELPVGRWILDPKLTGSESIGGVKADHVTGRLDAAGALHDIFSAVRSAGGTAPDLSGSGADEVRKAVDAASVDVWSGHDDHLLRRLRLAVSFRVQPPASLRAKLGQFSGGRFAFDVELGRVNQPVDVKAPAGAKPASALGT
jgi:hypothetical protein